jgi:SAM-dependent methyltransferase
MHKQHRSDVARGEGSRRLEAFWRDHWGRPDVELETLSRGLERTDLWRLFRANLPKGGRVLEAGCGPAHWVKFLSERGYRVFGVDLAAAALARSKSVAPALALAVGDLGATPFRSGTFDAYVSLGVIEHFEEGPTRVLEEALRVVRPGGTFLFTVPYLSLAKRFMILRHRSAPESGEFYQYVMRGSELRCLLEGAGLEVVKVSCFEVEGGLQNRVPAVGKLKESIRRSPRPWLKRLTPIFHWGWDFTLRLLPRPALAHMVMAVCRKPP